MPEPPAIAAIALGSNLGDRTATLDRAVAALAMTPGVRLRSVSSHVETEPVGPVPQGVYINAAALVETTLTPRGLLLALLAVERSLGRVRAQRWGPRTIDLDLLVHAQGVIDEPGLTLPHPRLHERAFVLAPLAQIAPGLVVPGRGTVASLLAALADQQRAPGVPGAR